MSVLIPAAVKFSGNDVWTQRNMVTSTLVMNAPFYKLLLRGALPWVLASDGGERAMAYVVLDVKRGECFYRGGDKRRREMGL